MVTVPTEDIRVENVSMTFRLSQDKVTSIKEYAVRLLKRNMRFTEVHALNSVSFQIYRGERIGIIGHNGAGKSTLLKILSRVIKPTEGKVKVEGEVSPLLELGAGFDPELSGSENIYLNGAILGKSKAFLEENYDEIVDFSGLGDFISAPVKTYSSGMRARLGFSIATQVQPDILIVDEVLGVGDEQFRKKSSDKMMEMIHNGKTVLLVSHNLNEIKRLTNRVIWLHQGRIREIGPTNEVCANFEQYMKSISQ